MVEDSAFRSQPIEVGRLHEVETVARQAVPSLLVGCNEEKVASQRGFPCAMMDGRDLLNELDRISRL